MAEKTEATTEVKKSDHRPGLLRKLILWAIVILVSGNIGYRMGLKKIGTDTQNKPKTVVTNIETPADRNVDFQLFWEVWSKLEQSFLDKEKLDARTMVYGAISGMVNSLGDPYTVFLTPEQNGDFKEDLQGSFEGIGAQLGEKEERIVVIAPLKDSPAQKAGLKPGDWIIKVNDEETVGWTVPEAVGKIRGPGGTSVTLNILHEGAPNPVDIKVVRDQIVLKSVEVEYKKVDESCAQSCPEVAWIRLTRFGDGTNDEWNAAVSQVRERYGNGLVKGIILDVRNNPGGYFQSAIHVASEFIKSGVVVVQQNSDGTKETFSVNRLGNLLEQPLVVLINKGSASAAEIVAGALRDYKRGKLIGETTFGKGSVQSPEDLGDGSGLHITTARWIMPKGEWINGTGIKPDIEVKMPIDASPSADLQLERAIEELR